jgi:hypothetical protein
MVDVGYNDIVEFMVPDKFSTLYGPRRTGTVKTMGPNDVTIQVNDGDVVVLFQVYYESVLSVVESYEDRLTQEY